LSRSAGDRIQEEPKERLRKYFTGLSDRAYSNAMIGALFTGILTIIGSISFTRGDWRFIIIIIGGYVIVDSLMEAVIQMIDQKRMGLRAGYIWFFIFVIGSAIIVDKVTIPLASGIDHFIGPYFSALLWSLLGTASLSRITLAAGGERIGYRFLSRLKSQGGSGHEPPAA